MTHLKENFGQMTLKHFSDQMLPAIEQELRRQVGRLDLADAQGFHEMLAYHMGWTEDGSVKSASGKRIRPILVLLVDAACGGEWLRAAPAAAAIELIHNFSLLHDDIEDNSPTRRGRLTAWKKFGVPMAINAGDALFAIADLAIIQTASNFNADTVLAAAQVLHNSCLALTQGQFLDISYEKRLDLRPEAYWPMVRGKTAALLAASAEIGAIFGGRNSASIQRFAEFGRNLGLAFQVQDDILGIWGDEQTTGKSAASDLVEAKNSLPIIFGIAQKGPFAERWARGPITRAETSILAQLLKDEGAYDYCAQEAERLTNLALEALRFANPVGDAGAALFELADTLLSRQS